jgi:hypothetical protein
MILSEPTVIKKVFFNTELSTWMYITTKLFYFVPCFQFGKMFGDIANVACAHFDINQFHWVISESNFEYEDLWRIQEGMFLTMDKYYVVSFIDTSYTLVYITIFYSTLAWYFDNVNASNRGISRPLYFPLMPSYWLGTDTVGDALTMDSIVAPFLSATAKVEAEKILALEKRQENVNGVRAISLSKSYKDNKAL